MSKGVIVKVLSGFYYVSSSKGVIECKARGRFRFNGLTPITGDRVSFSETDEGKGVIDKLYDRRNSFVRPAVANIDLMVIIASSAIPRTDPFLIDRMAVMAVKEKCGVAICINKSDLDSADRLIEIYSSTGYDVLRTSAATGEGIDELRCIIDGKICALSGNTGVGKSSIINAICPGLSLNTGDISRKLGRGRHTTRHVELFPLGERTFIADTPGFASFDTGHGSFSGAGELEGYFPEFIPFLGQCRFSDCAHINEPGCEILKAVSETRIHPSRHLSYSRMLAKDFGRF